MPWGVNDVEEHKKGLSAKQKKKWVEIANGVLRECQEMNQGDCDRKAIRVANSKTGGKNGGS